MRVDLTFLTLNALVFLSDIFQDLFKNGNALVVAEGYLFEFERRGYLRAGAFVPEVVTEHPELVKQLHEEFVHAGSDVVLAFTVRSFLENNMYFLIEK